MKFQKDQVSLRRFGWLLKQRGYQYWPENRLEEKIRLRGKRPDFYVEDHRGTAFLVEIESFIKAGPLRSTSSSPTVMASDPEEAYKRIRIAVKHASEQLRPYRTLKIPLLVVLDNWRQVGLPSNILDLRNAMFGTLEVRQQFDSNCGVLGPPKWHPGKGQRLNRFQGTYVSAVAWNLPKTRDPDDPMTHERTMYVRMIHNPYSVIPFPIPIFNSGDDEHFGYNRNGQWGNLS